MRKKLLERIDLVLTGGDKFYKPQAPKNFVAAVPKEMVANGKALDGAKDIPVMLTWEPASANSRKFRVERKVDVGDFQAITETGDKKFCDEKQPLDTQLAYRIIALNTAGESPASEPIPVKTPPPKIVNLLPAGDFESGAARDWGLIDNAGKNVSITSEGTHGGKGALLFSGEGGTDRQVAVKDGTKYLVTGWVKARAARRSGRRRCLLLHSLNGLHGSRPHPHILSRRQRTGPRRSSKLTPNEWTKFEYTFTAKGNQIRFRMHKFHDDNTDAMFDDFVLSEAP